jgi:hypothetical protein
LELLVIGLFDLCRPWWWLLLVTLPLCVWFLKQDQRNLQSKITVFLDEVAREEGFTKIQPDPK